MANDINKDDPHYKGEYGSIYEVNRKFPTGGVAGDFVVIDGWAHYWNADRGTWCVNAERDSYWDELITNIIEKFKLVRGATYMGVASLDTVPAKAIGAKMYYFATVAGTYKNFDNLVVPQGINVLYSENGSSWVNTTLLEVAQELGMSTNKVVSQKTLNDALAKKFDKESVAQESGEAEDKVMSQKAVSDKLGDLSINCNFIFNTSTNSVGTIIEKKGFATTGKVDVSAYVGKKIVLRSNVNFSDNVYGVFYDESGTFIENTDYKMAGTRMLEVPTNAKYICITVLLHGIENTSIESLDGLKIWTPYKEDVDAVKDMSLYRFIPNRYINKNNAVDVAYSYCITNKIDVSAYVGSQLYWYCGKEITDTNARLVVFNSNNEALDYWSLNGKRPIDIPEGASYILATMVKEAICDSYIIDSEGHAVWLPISTKHDEDIDKNLVDLSSGLSSVINFDVNLKVSSGGELEEKKGFATTGKVDVSAYVGKKIVLRSNLSSKSNGYCAFYDNSGAFVNNSDYLMSGTREIPVPDNAKFVIMTVLIDNTDSLGGIEDTSIESIGKLKLWTPYRKTETGIPSYYHDYLLEKELEINRLPLESSRNCDDFIFITDMHIEVNYMKSPLLIRHLVDNTNVKKLFNGGDVMNGQATREEGRIQLRKWMDSMSFIDQYITLGNHDTNSSWSQTKDGWFSYDEVYNMLYKPLEEKINTNGQLYYCLDNASQKIRYFFLNAQWTEETTNHNTVLDYDKQLNWMKTECTKLDETWSIVVLQHIFYADHNQTLNSDGSYTTNQAYRASIASSLLSALNDINKDKSLPNVRFVLVGHTHWDWVEFFEGGFPVIATSSDASYNWDGPGDHPWTKKKGTVEEQCFDVFHTDYGKGLITSIRIGQGSNRKAHMKIIEVSKNSPYKLVSSLTGNVAWRSVYEDIASVDNGNVTGKTSGITTIIADNKNGEQEFWGINVVV